MMITIDSHPYIGQVERADHIVSNTLLTDSQDLAWAFDTWIIDADPYIGSVLIVGPEDSPNSIWGSFSTCVHIDTPFTCLYASDYVA